ncbi:hypothetical protein SAMN06266982_12323 [Propioniciclava tarda]|nr:hypothetical protein SAMN06266982_12323 [Propioniciclava tarda]
MTLIGVVAGIAVLDPLLLWCENRGWIVYRSRRPGSAGVGAGIAGELMNLFQPTRQVTVDEQKWQRTRVDQAESSGSAPEQRVEIDLDAGHAWVPTDPDATRSPVSTDPDAR